MDSFSFDMAVTLDDQLVLQLRCLQAPVMRAGQLRRDAIIVLVAAACAPLALAGGLFIAWVGDPHRTSFTNSLRDLVLDQPGVLLAAVLVMVACSLGGAVLQRLLLRPRLRRLLRRVLRTRPDVDPADPRLTFRARVSVSDEGLESRSAAVTVLVPWTVLTWWEETATHILVLGNAMTGFCLGTAAADPAPLDRLRAILAARLGPATGPNRPMIPRS